MTELNPLLVVLFAIIFFLSEDCLFTLFIVFFAVQKLLSLIRSHSFTFVFVSITLGGGSQRILLLCHQVFCLSFPLRVLIVSGLTFRSLIHFKFIFVYGVQRKHTDG